jgi:hypothetical protein
VPLVKAHTELRRDWKDAPMAFWVHREIPPDEWRGAAAYNPPAPKSRGRSGYPFLVVAFGPHTLEFSSQAQLTHFIEVLSKKPLPTTRALSKLRGTSTGPNSHWLSRLPAVLKGAKGRGQLVAALSRLPPSVWSAPPNKSLERTRDG